MPAPNKDMLVTRRTLAFNAELCTGCMRCLLACTYEGVLGKDEQGRAFLAHPERCSFCLTCVHRCPTHAIRPVTVEVGPSLFDYSVQPTIAPGQPGRTNVFAF